MPVARPRIAARVRSTISASSRSGFHSCSSSKASVLFALDALANSRETQHFNKISKLSRVEHSPPLKLIKSSEVDPFPLPAPARSSPPSTAWQTSNRRSTAKVWDERALQIGRVILTDQARRMHRLQRALDRAKRREVKQNEAVVKEKRAWHAERQKLRDDMRAAGIWILISVTTATVLATWRFWPQRDTVQDPGQLGRRIAAKTAAAMPLPAATVSEPVAPVANPVTPAMPIKQQAVLADRTPAVEPQQSRRSWLGALFWKQE